jgi:hypothetical protein
MRVVSVSWPTAEMRGMALTAAARTTGRAGWGSRISALLTAGSGHGLIMVSSS